MGFPDRIERSVELAQRVIRTTSSLDPWGYVVHVAHGEMWPGSWAAWQRHGEASLRKLIQGGADPLRLCVENMETIPPEQSLSLASRVGTSTCLDVGHLWRAGRDPVFYLNERFARARIVHLHGWDGHRDHCSLKATPLRQIRPLIERLCDPDFGGLVTLEVFNEEDLLSSWERLAELVQTI